MHVRARECFLFPGSCDSGVCVWLYAGDRIVILSVGRGTWRCRLRYATGD